MDAYQKALEASFAPLVELILKKKVKKKKDIHALSMKPPMGLRPDDVTPELGTKFVKEFVPIAWEATKEKFKKKTMKNLRALFQESKDSGAFKVVASTPSQSEEKKIQPTQAKSPSPPVASTVPEKQLKEMMNKGFSQHSSEMWYSAFEMLDTNGRGKIDVSSLSTFFTQFGETLEQDEAEFILSKLRRPRGGPEEAKDKGSSVGLVNFATYMNAKMKSSPSEVSRYHQPRFGAAFDLFTQKGSMMTSTHVQNAMAILQEPVTVEVIFFFFFVLHHLHTDFMYTSRKRLKWQRKRPRNKNLSTF